MLIPARRQPAREAVRIPPDSSLRVARHRPERFDFRWHHHPEVELTLIDVGSGLRAVGDSIERYGPGDVVLIGPDTPHSWMSEPDSPCGSVVVQFPPGLLAAGPEGRRLADLFERARVGLVGPAGVASDLIALAATTDAIERLGLLVALLGRIDGAQAWRPLAHRAPPPLRRRDPRLARALAHIHDHHQHPIELRDLARLVGMSASSFSRSFRRALGITCGDYLARQRIAACCRDLLGSDTDAGRIAFANGFTNLASFHRWFLRVTGTTPGRWRRGR